ncbi:MAG: hypothetical protein XD50_1437 [Clostridia bacterium 41_269]|nr:MAG: hypothetical protein XD50_1437 [Clostridia bacterium 41_269]
MLILWLSAKGSVQFFARIYKRQLKSILRLFCTLFLGIMIHQLAYCFLTK